MSSVLTYQVYLKLTFDTLFKNFVVSKLNVEKSASNIDCSHAQNSK